MAGTQAAFMTGAGQSATNLQAAKHEMDAITNMYNKMVDMCYTKCIQKANESDLTTGENACVDRCVAKYVAAHNQVGVILTATQQPPQ